YAVDPDGRLGRCLSEGFAYQGEPSRHHGEQQRGGPRRELPSTCFINFLQDHDHVGNRAVGERLVSVTSKTALRAVTSRTLLYPAIPGLFMGEEFGCRQPFLYFADFTGELAEAVRNGRRREFASFATFGGDEVPDPIDEETFRRSILQWTALDEEEHAGWLRFYRELLEVRHRFVVPRLPASGRREVRRLGDTGLRVSWQLQHGAELVLLANLGE